jgi:hypothetical protein
MLREVFLGNLSLSKYAFIDKTGTLTEYNKYDIRMIMIGNKKYTINTNMLTELMKAKSNI